MFARRFGCQLSGTRTVSLGSDARADSPMCDPDWIVQDTLAEA